MPYNGRLETTPLLDIVQIVAYSQQSGLLSIKGTATKGLLIFENGNIVCAYSPETLPMLVAAAKESVPDKRLELRQGQVLRAMKELFGIPEGDYRFVHREEPVSELEGLDLRPFYDGGALDTGDLLLALQKWMDPDQAPPAIPATNGSSNGTSPLVRQDPRLGPFSIPATLTIGEHAVSGYLTNLSRGGTFFHADELPEVGAVCRVRFELPGELGQCRAQVKVAWQSPDGADTRKGVGLTFLEFSPDTKRRIALCLERFSDLAADVDFEA